MRFSDFFRTRSRKQVGRIVEAGWAPAEHGIRFTILFEPSNRRIQGVCRAGNDPVTRTFVSERDLMAKLPDFKNLKVYESPLGGDPNTMSPEEFREMKIELSLSNLTVGYQGADRPLSANSFISRLFR